MAFDALTLSVLCKEFAEALTGGKITKIYQPERDEIVLYVFNGRTYKLLISANANVNRIHLTDMPTDNPKTAPGFCMLLRKHITNATVASVRQMPYERVVEFSLRVTDELGYKRDMKLIFELTGKTSNLILTDENYIIADSIKHLPQDIDSTRIILSGAKYAFFAPQNKIPPCDLPRIRQFLSSCGTPLRKTLPEVLLGTSQNTVNEMLCGIDEDDHSEQNNDRVARQIAQYMDNLAHPQPNVVLRSGSPADVCPFDYRSQKGDKTFYPTLNAAHDAYFYLLDKAQRFNDKAKSAVTVVKNAISRTEKKLAIQRQSVLEAESRDQLKKFGDLILSNLWQIKPGASSLTCCDYTDGSTVTVPLDSALSPQQNAQLYYKKYRKMKSSALHNARLVEENSHLLDYLQTIKDSLGYCTDADDLQQIRDELAALGLIRDKQPRKKAAELPAQPLHYRVDGFDVLVGKNNAQNSYVTFRAARQQDIWLHAHQIHSSHVLIVTNGAQVPDGTIVKAAEICAYYSQARGGTRIPIDYTLRHNVRKPSGAPMGMALYDGYNTIVVDPDRHVSLLVQ